MLDKIRDLKTIIIEMVVIIIFPCLLCFFVLPYINLTNLKIPILDVSFKTGTPEKFYYILAVILLEIVLFKLMRKYNSDKVFLTGNYYHDYYYCVFWFAAKILGYEKCTLKMVPIHMQYRLVLNSTFKTYLSGDDFNESNNITGYEEEKNSKVKVSDLYKDNYEKTVNIVICDTYNITKRQLPNKTKGEYTIFIKRSNTFDGRKKYNEDFLHKIQTTIETLDGNINTVNLFCTTNPRHNIWIIQNVFSKGKRSNIKHIYVAQQENFGERRFVDKYIKVK